MKWNPCATCGMDCQTKILRPSDSGGDEIFCRECMQEARGEYEYNKTQLTKRGKCLE